MIGEPVAVPIEQMLICADEERTGTARRIDNAKFGRLFRRFVFQQFADGVLNDVIDDVGRRVIDAARFLDLRLVVDSCLMSFGEADDFAEELFVDLTEDVGGENRELVRAVGIIKSTNDSLENGIVDSELGCEVVRRFDPIFFLLKVKQTGIVTLVSLAKELVQPAISVFPVEQHLQATIALDAAIFADAEKDDAINGALDTKV